MLLLLFDNIKLKAMVHKYQINNIRCRLKKKNYSNINSTFIRYEYEIKRDTKTNVSI